MLGNLKYSVQAQFTLMKLGEDAAKINKSAFTLGSQLKTLLSLYSMVNPSSVISSRTVTVFTDNSEEVEKFFIDAAVKSSSDELKSFAFGFVSSAAIDLESAGLVSATMPGHDYAEADTLIDKAMEKAHPKSMIEKLTYSKPCFDLVNQLFEKMIGSSYPDSFYQDAVDTYNESLGIEETQIRKAFMLTISKFKVLKPLNDLTVEGDILNFSHKMWQSSSDKGAFSNLSYKELVSYAVTKAIKKIKKYL